MIKILVVDDEAGICDVIEQIFTDFGFSVFTATNANKALNIFKKEKPKIIFLDIIMPDISGLDLLQEFMKIDPQCVVIMVTASDDKVVQEKSLRLGAVEFVRKPFSHNYVRDVVIEKIKYVLDQGGHMEKPSILIVDDEEIRFDMKKSISKRFECDIDLASSGQEAIEKAKNKPDVILLDIRMPGMTGFDALPEIKKISPQSKIIIVSAWNSTDTVNLATSIGITDYIGKPSTPEAVAEKLQSVLMSIGKLILKNKK